ncbi:AbrB family transcriptional regulator [Proteus mirabilis]|nr:AbrB family transcriptional regulator [Proteus mirabilis]
MRTRTVAVFKNGSNRAIRLPKDFDFDGVNEQEISRDGDCIILRPVKPNWISLQNEKKADSDFLLERDDIIDEGRVIL